MSNRTNLVHAAFSALSHAPPAKIPQRGIVYTSDGRTAICALTSKMYSGQGGLERAWSAIRTGTRAKLDGAIQNGGTAYLAFSSPLGMFLLPWDMLSRLTGDNTSSKRDPIVLEVDHNDSWAFVGPRGHRTNIDQYRLAQAA